MASKKLSMSRKSSKTKKNMKSKRNMKRKTMKGGSNFPHRTPMNNKERRIARTLSLSNGSNGNSSSSSSSSNNDSSSNLGVNSIEYKNWLAMKHNLSYPKTNGSERRSSLTRINPKYSANENIFNKARINTSRLAREKELNAETLHRETNRISNNQILKQEQEAADRFNQVKAKESKEIKLSEEEENDFKTLSKISRPTEDEDLRLSKLYRKKFPEQFNFQ
jgi:hypothetical protein